MAAGAPWFASASRERSRGRVVAGSFQNIGLRL
jgi:hypothetical protein